MAPAPATETTNAPAPILHIDQRYGVMPPEALLTLEILEAAEPSHR